MARAIQPQRIGHRIPITGERLRNPPKKRRWRPYGEIHKVREIAWRDPRTGRKTSPPKKGKRYAKGTYPRREERVWQVDSKGYRVRALELTSRRRIVRTSVADEPLRSVDFPPVPGVGRRPVGGGRGISGMIDPALGMTGLWRHIRGAKRISVLVSGINTTGQTIKVKRDFDTRGVKNIRSLIVYGVIDALRFKGYRTTYNIDRVDWQRLRPIHYWTGDRSRANLKSEVRKLRQLRSTDIVVTVDK